jgi:hypothetical protein
LLCFSLPAKAQTSPFSLPPPTVSKSTSLLDGQRLVAEADTSDDSYDPFADYSEFEEAADEEEDINFFRNGRLLTIGFLGGYQGFTGNFAKMYVPSASFGLNLSYFFDLSFALQVGYSSSSHGIQYTDSVQHVTGNISYEDFGLNVKYYFNTQNVTRGLAQFNPYLIVGFSEVFRTTTLTTSDVYGKASAFGFNAGAGFEIPMLRNKMYFGGQAMFQYVNFPDSNQYLQGPLGYTGLKQNGDAYTISGLIGVNF